MFYLPDPAKTRLFRLLYGNGIGCFSQRDPLELLLYSFWCSYDYALYTIYPNSPALSGEMIVKWVVLYTSLPFLFPFFYLSFTRLFTRPLHVFWVFCTWRSWWAAIPCHFRVFGESETFPSFLGKANFIGIDWFT